MNKVVLTGVATKVPQLTHEVRPGRKPILYAIPVPEAKPTMNPLGTRAALLEAQAIEGQSRPGRMSRGQRFAQWIKMDPQPPSRRGAVVRLNHEVQRRLLDSTVPVADGYGGKEWMTVRALRALYWERAGVDITQQSVFGWSQAFERQWMINRSGNMPALLNAPLAAAATVKNRLADPLLDEVAGHSSTLKYTRYDADYVWKQIQRNKANIVVQLRRERAQK